MNTQFTGYKVLTKENEPWIDREIMVYKWLAPFVWVGLNVEFDTVEEAEEYVKYAPMLEVV